MSKLRPWKQELLSFVGEGVRPFGFTKRKGQDFLKLCQFGRVGFQLCFIDHSDDFDATAHTALRYDAVEEMINGDDKLMTNAEKRDTYTVGAELGNLSEGKQKRWRVASEEDIPGAAASILDAFQTVALPYIERLSDKEYVLEVLSDDGPDAWLYSAFPDYRAKAAVSLAFLLRGKTAALELAEKKLAFLEEINQRGLPFFRSFVDKLRSQHSG